jgi:hypothetical protein
MAQLEETCRNFRPFPEARAELIREPAAGVFKGIIGSYGRVTGATAYLAFIGDLASARVQECTGYTGEGLILEAARLAPSARNRQPWRFRIKENEIVIRTDKDVAHEAISRRLDCGIAMLHFELGVRAAGLSGEWEFLSRPEVARFRVHALEWDSPPLGPRQLPRDGEQAPRGSE